MGQVGIETADELARADVAPLGDADEGGAARIDQGVVARIGAPIALGAVDGEHHIGRFGYLARPTQPVDCRLGVVALARELR